MQRSQIQVLFSSLPEKVFLHETGLLVRSSGIRGESMSGSVNKTVVLQEIDNYLSAWVDDARVGMPRSFVGRASDVSLQSPKQVQVDIWPLIFECSNESCKRIIQFRSAQDIPGHARCATCHSRLRQLRYYYAHECGRIQALYIPKCATHGYTDIYFEDTGNFRTAAFRCRACGNSQIQRTTQTPCSCEFRDSTGRSMMRAYRVNDTRTYYSHYVSLVNFRSTTFDRLQGAPDRGALAVGAYLGLVPDIAQAIEERPGQGFTQTPRLTDQEWRVAEAKYLGMGLKEGEIAILRRSLGPAQSGVAALQGIEPHLSHLGEEQAMLEWAMLFAGQECPMHTLEERLTDAGSRGDLVASGRLEATRDLMERMRIGSIAVSWNFPIALATFGYSRGTKDPHNCHISGFPINEGQEAGSTAVYGMAAETEAVIVSLDPAAVLKWLEDRGLPLPSGFAERDPRHVVLEVFADPDLAASALAAKDLCHTMSHCMLKALAESQVGFAEASLAEWIVPQALTFAIYESGLQSEVLGTTWTLINDRCIEWLETSREAASSCENDPMCHHGQPRACERCLYIAFGCKSFNDGLDREYLYDYWYHA